MKSLNLFIAALLLISAQSCKNPKADQANSTVTVQLNNMVGSRPLSFVNTTYIDGLGNQIYFTDFQMYLSHFSLVKSDNSLVEINPVAFINYTDSASRSFTVKVPSGTYTGIVFHFGLDKTQNNTDPDNYPITNPLGPQNSMYWSWLKHRFLNLDGRIDSSSSNFVNGIGLDYHVGTDTCYRAISLTGSPITIVEGANNKPIALNLDIFKIFYGQQDTLYPITYPGTQSDSSDLSTAIKFSNQITKAFTYSQ